MVQILGATQIDFIGKRSLAAAFSLLVIVVGLGAVADRRSAIFDIDFLGGTSVTMYLDKTAGKYDKSDSVRSIVGEVLGKVEVRGAKVGYSLSKVEMEDEPDKVAWKLDTSIPSESVKQTADNGAATLLVPFAEGDRPSGNANVVDGVSFLKQQLQEAAGFGGGENGQSAFAHYQVTVEESTFEEVPQESSEGAPQAPAAEPATADQQNPANPQPAEPAAADDTEAPAPGNEDGARWEQPQQRIASLRRQGFVVAQEETPPAAAADETAPTVDASATDPAAAATDAEQPVTGPASAAGKVDTVGILEFQEKYPINGITLKQELSDAAADAGIPLEVDDDELLDEGNIHVAKAAADSRDVDPNWLASDPSPQLRWRVTLVGLPRDKALTVVRQLKKSFAEEPIWLSSSTIGGRVAGDMRATAVAALFASLLGIVGYLWIRFQRVIYGLAAVVALLHDVLITLGAIALSAYMADYLGWLMIEEFKISLPMVAAFLTIVGYSLNDTIVVFDRIREVRGKSPSITDVMINTSINQTLRRTLLTSLTTLIVVVILYAFGGAGIHGFAFALVVGVIVGTYSSIFVASPALLWMARRAVARGDTV
jgi:SecD/SecF fusion protein